MESPELLNLQAMIDSILKKLDSFKIPEMPEASSSVERNELFAALAKAQGSMTKAGANKENIYYQSKYADLDSIIEASRKPLSDNGLSVTQKIIHTDGAHILQSVLGHSSGQWDSSTVALNPPQNDIETFGSYFAAIKRHAFAALVGIASEQEDDDGEVSMYDERKKVKTPPLGKLKLQTESYDTITSDQREQLEYELKRHPNPEEVCDRLYNAFHITHLAGIPKSKFISVITKVREVINAETKASSRS